MIFTEEQRQKAKETAARKREERISMGLSATANPVEKLSANKTAGNAIKAMCYDCMGRTEHWRNDVKTCTSPNCPLFDFRPGRTKNIVK